MSEHKDDVSSLFDLEYHETATVNEDTKVLRVPNGWIYHFNLSGVACTSVFVPEYIPAPPPETNNEGAQLDAEICDLLNDRLGEINGGTYAASDEHVIQLNRLIRQLQKRNKPGE